MTNVDPTVVNKFMRFIKLITNLQYKNLIFRNINFNQRISVVYELRTKK